MKSYLSGNHRYSCRVQQDYIDHYAHKGWDHMECTASHSYVQYILADIHTYNNIKITNEDFFFSTNTKVS